MPSQRMSQKFYILLRLIILNCCLLKLFPNLFTQVRNVWDKFKPNVTNSWLLANGLDINNLPPLKYNHGTDQTLISHEDRNKVIRQEIWQIYTRYKWITPREPLPSKMVYYKEHFLRFSKLGFITRPRYLDTFLSNALRVAIGKLRISSHQLEIENGRANRVPREERLCTLCHIEIEDEYDFTCKCPTYAEIRAEYQDVLGPSPTLSKLLDTRM